MDASRGHVRPEDLQGSVASAILGTFIWLLIGAASRWFGEVGGAVFVVTLTALYLWMQLNRSGTTSESLRRPPAWIWVGLTSAALCALIFSLMVSVVGWWPDDPKSLPAPKGPLHGDFGYTILLAPVIEEVGFRGMALSRLQARTGQSRAIVWTAVIFAVLHLQPWGLGPRFLAGLLFGFAACATGSIWSAVILHAAVNLSTIAATHLAPWCSTDVAAPLLRVVGPGIFVGALALLSHLTVGGGRRLTGRLVARTF